MAGAHALEAVLEVAAEQARIALGVSTVSVSRWDRGRDTLQTLVNVGELAPGEERWPEAELYPLLHFPRTFNLLSRGCPHLTDVNDPDADPQERQLLAALGKGASVAVPIVSEGETWGELYATLALADGRAFGARDLRFMSAVAGQVSAAIARAEVFSLMERFAFEDPLTGLVNRRALEERLAAAIEDAVLEGGDVALVLCDLDGLKQTNDLLGHEAGDRRLVTAAEALRATAATRPGALAARIGGDEFCLLLAGAGVEDGRRLAEDFGDRLGASSSSPVTASCGVAALHSGPRSAAELLRLADAAQYRAKRGGPGRVCIAGTRMPAADLDRPQRRQVREMVLGPFERLITETVELLDGELAGEPAPQRIAAVLDACAQAVGAESWSLARVRPGTDLLETIVCAEADDLGRRATRRFWFPGDVQALADLPAIRAVLRDGDVLLASVDGTETQPSERAVMVARGCEHLLAVAVRSAEGPMLVRLLADTESGSLPRLAPFARALLAHAARP